MKEEKIKELQKDVACRIRKHISNGKAKKGKGALLFDPKLPNDWRLDLVYGEKQTYVSIINLHWIRCGAVGKYVANDNEFEIEQAAYEAAYISIDFDNWDSIMEFQQYLLAKRTIIF